MLNFDQRELLLAFYRHEAEEIGTGIHEKYHQLAPTNWRRINMATGSKLNYGGFLSPKNSGEKT